MLIYARRVSAQLPHGVVSLQRLALHCESPHLKFWGNAKANCKKIKRDGIPYLDLVSDLKGQSQQFYCDNAPLKQNQGELPYRLNIIKEKMVYTDQSLLVLTNGNKIFMKHNLPIIW
jgi:hypothetical protein